MKKIIILIIVVIVCFIIIRIDFGFENECRRKIVFQDTDYNHIIIDSISHKINHFDTTIINIKKVMNEEVKQALSDDDSDAVRKFYELTKSM